MWLAIDLIIIVIGFSFAIIYPFISMEPADTGKVADTDIITVKNGRNAVYFLNTADGIIAIDAGANLTSLEKSLIPLPINPMDVRHIFITHGDSDHIAGLSLFPNAQLYIGEDEIQMLNGTTKRSSFLGNNTLPDGYKIEQFTTLSDKQELMIGNVSIYSIKSPGHTPGSMTFLVNQNYLFTGDAIRIDDNKILIHPLSMSKARSKETIFYLKNYMNDCKYILTAHYGYCLTENLQIK